MVDKVVVVGGVGDVLGKSVARRFAREGLIAALVARDAGRLERIAAEIRAEGGRANAYPADMSAEADVVSLFHKIEDELGAVHVAAYVAATRVEGPIIDTSAADFEKAWRLSCFSGFLFGREAARRMLPRREGTILFTGAAGSFRGRAQFGAFDAAKGALRHMAQSMARDLGPKGIHVATVLIEGAIESERMRKGYPERMASLGPDGAVQPDDIAETYWQVHCQPRNAWTLEVDLRPWSEKF
jgi:NAD(P)-dependent dehydrogenase (short-subunit alcohol dehydrogenase family)